MSPAEVNRHSDVMAACPQVSGLRSATVAMPWRPQPFRIPPYERVMQFWTEHNLPVVTADSDPRSPFNHGQAYTAAVAAADTDIVVLIDPDTLPDPLAVEEAIATVEGEVIWLFDDYRVISQDWVQRDDLWNAPLVEGEEWRSYSHATGVCCVFRQETFWRLGGMDKRTSVSSDLAFVCAASTLVGTRRLHATAYSFDHPSDGGSRTLTYFLDDGRRYTEGHHGVTQLYKDADGDPDAMELLLQDPERGVVARGVEEWKAKYPTPAPGKHYL